MRGKALRSAQRALVSPQMVRTLRKAKSIRLGEKLYRVTAVAALAAITSVACERPSSGQNLTRDEPSKSVKIERSAKVEPTSGWFTGPSWFGERDAERNSDQLRQVLGGKEKTVK